MRFKKINNYITKLFGRRLVIFALLFLLAAKGSAQSPIVDTNAVLLVSVPFEIVEGSIIVSLKINNSNRSLRMLFDTGASGMAVSKSLADSLGLIENEKRSASVVGGNMAIGISIGNTISLGGLAIPDLKIALFDKLKGGIDGILGNVICKRYITSINMDAKTISLYSPGNFECPKMWKKIPIELSGSVFLIEGNLELTPGLPVSGKFVFDTGASYSLICFRPFVLKNRLLVSGFKPESVVNTTSMGVSIPTFNGKAFRFSLNGLAGMENAPVALMSSNGQDQNWQPGVDGSVGMGLIGNYNFTVNAFKKEIYVSIRN